MTRAIGVRSGGTGPVIVVCPTARGGHIEHAFDLAVAGYRRTGQRSILLTRHGARDYLPQRAGDFVVVEERLPELPSSHGHLSNVWFFLNLVREHIAIVRAARAAQPSAVFVEEPRYPFPSVFNLVRGAKSVLVLHNVVEHDGLRRSNPIVDWIRLRSVRKFPAVLVHGEAQQQLLSKNVGRVAAWSDLPTNSYAEWLWQSEASAGPRSPDGTTAFVCLGEIRANKGIETAIGAARRAGVPLTVRGRGVDPTYLASLRRLAEQSTNITVVDEFLSPLEFSDHLDASLALVIPYTSFEAQSGPLAKGMARNKRILSSRLPALVDQAKGYDNISFFDAGDQAALAALMLGVSEDGAAGSRPRRNGQDPESAESDPWDATLKAALADV